jgi:hypothetical protein
MRSTPVSARQEHISWTNKIHSLSEILAAAMIDSIRTAAHR